MGCCGCFDFLKRKRSSPAKSSSSGFGSHYSDDVLLKGRLDEGDYESGERGRLDGGDYESGDSNGLQTSTGGSDNVDGLPSVEAAMKFMCRRIPVKETHRCVKSQDANGNKWINEYLQEFKIGLGSYAKVVLYRSNKDGKRYAIKVFRKSHLVKMRVGPSQNALTDVMREISIMKRLDHPNIVNLIEVIDEKDRLYMVLEYVEKKWVFDDDSGLTSSLGEQTARRYLRDIVAGLMYLHSHNVIHGDIKPDNLLITGSGRVKICDFSVSQVVEDDNDMLQRTPGTPAFTAPECCQGLNYHGKSADIWALGVVLYCMITGKYPFKGASLLDTYDKIVTSPLKLPVDMDQELKHLLERILSKDPYQRITLEEVAEHPWTVRDEGPIPGYACYCKRTSLTDSDSRNSNNL